MLTAKVVDQVVYKVKVT